MPSRPAPRLSLVHWLSALLALLNLVAIGFIVYAVRSLSHSVFLYLGFLQHLKNYLYMQVLGALFIASALATVPLVVWVSGHYIQRLSELAFGEPLSKNRVRLLQAFVGAIVLTGLILTLFRLLSIA